MAFQLWHKWVNGRAVGGRPLSHEGVRGRGRRTKPRLEVLEDRTLLSTGLGVTFDDGSGPLAELPALSYSWGATNPPVLGGGGGGAGRASLQDFTLTFAPTSVESGLWGHLAAGSHVKSATIHVRQLLGGAETEYLVYTLKDVVISSFTTNNNGSAAPPDTVQLHFGQVTESYSPINPDGTLGTANTAQYNQATATSGGSGSLNGPRLPGAPDVGLTLAGNNEMAAISYSWGATNPPAPGGGAGRASLQDFTLTLAPTSVEPALWSALATGQVLTTAAVHVRKSLSGGQTEYLNYTLSKVLVSSFTTGEDGSGAPADTIKLSFAQVTQSYSPTNPDGTLGAANTAQYNQATATSGGSGSLAAPGPTGTPQVGLAFVEGGVTRPELAVTSYSWGATNPPAPGAGAGRSSLQDFTLTLAPTSVEPGLWGHLAAGTHLDSAAIHVRKALGGGTEYLTYTLQDVTISSFTTGASGSGAPVDTIKLNFAQVTESYSPTNPDGTLGAANTAQYNQATATSGGSGSLAAPGPTGTPQVGLTFVEGGVTRPELAVTSYSWGATNPAGVRPSLQDFTLTLAPSSAEPGLWGHLAIGVHLGSATIHVRKLLGGVETEYLTYTLQDVTISSFTTGASGSGAPVDTIKLSFAQVTESYSPTNPDGTLGAANTAQYNQATATSGGSGSLNGPRLPGAPDVGLTLAGNNELAAISYSWGATNPPAPGGGAGRASLQDFTLTLAPTSVEPALWSALATGQVLTTAAVHVRKSLSGGQTEYLNYTLSKVLVSSFTTGEDGSGAPADTIKLSFAQVTQSYSPTNPDGSLGAANTAQYNQATATSGGSGSLAAPGPTGTPQVGLAFVEGGVIRPELAVLGYSWGATNPAGARPSLQDFTLALAPTSVEPALWGHLAVGTHLNSATIHVRKLLGGGEIEYITYTLQDVTISSFTTGDNGSADPQDTIKLHFGEVTESYSPIKPDGTLGAPNTADYNQATATSGGAGSLGSPSPASGINTTTSLTTSQSSTAYGQSVDFIATVAPASGTGMPTGTVDFFDGTTDVSGPVLLTTVGGQQQATFTTAALGVATHTITATYNGTPTFNASTSSPVTQTVAQGTTTTSVSTSKSPTVYGELVAFTAVVSPNAPSTLGPTGAVDFFDGGTDVSGPVTVKTVGSQQVATFTTAALGVATHTIKAVFADPTSSYAGSSDTTSQVVNRDGTTTVLSSSAAGNASVFGQPVTFTAVVGANAPGGGMPTGPVQFAIDGSNFGAPVLLSSAGAASLTLNSLAVGNRSVTAVYAGDPNFTGSTSNAVTQAVAQGTTTTTVNTSKSPTVYGEVVVFTAVVSPNAPSTLGPTGAVFFFDVTTLIGSAPLAAVGGQQQAIFTTTVLSAGIHTIKAVFVDPTSNYAGSSSATTSQVVNRDGTTTALSSSTGGNASAFGQPVVFTAAVSANAPGAGHPTGPVQFVIDGSNFGAPVLLSSAGTASITLSSLGVGNHTVTAVYAGDPNFIGSTAPPITQVILGPGVTVVGTELFIVGGSATNDKIQVSPAGDSKTGSTGVQVKATLNGVKSKTTFGQAFSAVRIFGYAGDADIQLDDSLTLNAVITLGDGNDNVKAGGGNIILTAGNGKDKVALGDGNNTVTLGDGDDTVALGDGNNVVVTGNGKNDVKAGNGNNVVTAGNGKDKVKLGDGDNTVTLGNGDDKVALGDGNNVVVTGNGKDDIKAGDGANLIAAGLGQHKVQVGDGSNILIDGSVALTSSRDSLRQVLNDWIVSGAAAAASIRSRLAVTYNSSYANHLQAGSGLDWFWDTYAGDSTNRKATDLLN